MVVAGKAEDIQRILLSSGKPTFVSDFKRLPQSPLPNSSRRDRGQASREINLLPAYVATTRGTAFAATYLNEEFSGG